MGRDRVEVEAESVAYIVSRAAGLETDAYSFPYVGLWAGGDTELVAETGRRAIECAREILKALSEADVAEAA